MYRERALATALLALMLAACGSQTTTTGDDPVTAQPALPSGWRWESFGGVEVGVPGTWGWGDSGLRLDAWCINSASRDKSPVVARPGEAIPAIGCGDGGTSLANTGPVVGLGHAFIIDGPDPASSAIPTAAPGFYDPAPDGVTREGDRTTIHLSGVEVVIQAAPALREQIAVTVHRVDIDANGCPATHPLSLNPALRPTPPTDLTALPGAAAVSVCRYELRSSFAGKQGKPGLLSSLRLTGAKAEKALQAITRTPSGSGPDQPDNCAPEEAYGEQAIVLRIFPQTTRTPTELFVRYAGCTHHGFDDGTRLHQLTQTALDPFTTGPNAVMTFLTPPPQTIASAPPTRTATSSGDNKGG